MATSARLVVAVVDDDHRALESLAELLEAAGYKVRRYSSATQLCARDGLSGIDCLISDIGMAEMNGVELRRVALSKRPDLPVFLITGRYELRAQYASSIEHDRYFEKPFDGSQFLAAVRTALARATPSCPPPAEE